MSIKDMPPGELLFKIVNPYAPTVQIQKQGKEISKLKKNSKGSGHSGSQRGPEEPRHEGGGGSGASDTVPVVDLDAGWITTTSVFTADGLYTPQLTLTLPDTYSGVRGFVCYRMAVTRNADTTAATTHTITGTQYPYPGYSVLALSMPTLAAGEKVQVQVQVVSSYYGTGAWSAPVDYTVSADTTAPATLTGLVSGTQPGGTKLEWDVPTDADFSHTEVWLGNVGAAVKYVGSTKGHYMEVKWDWTSYAILSYSYAWVRPVDRSGNIGAWTSTAVNAGTVNSSDITDGAIDGAKLSSAISYTGILTIGTGGKVISNGGKAVFGENGLVITANGTSADQNIYFYGSDNVLIGKIYAYGDSVSGARIHVEATQSNTKLFLVAVSDVSVRSSGLTGTVTISGGANSSLVMGDNPRFNDVNGPRIEIRSNDTMKVWAPADTSKNTVEWYDPAGVLQTYLSTAGSLNTRQRVGFQLLSSTSTLRNTGSIQHEWAVNTDATRQGRVKIGAEDSAAWREAMRVEADGTKAKLGFYGGTAVAKPQVTGSRGGNAALASLLTALASTGLLTDSTTV